MRGGNLLDEEAQVCDFATATIKILVFRMTVRIMVVNRDAKSHSHNGFSMREVES